MKFNPRRKLRQCANLVQLPYRNRKLGRRIFCPDWSLAGVNQVEDLLDLKSDFFKFKDLKTPTKLLQS